MKTHHIWQYCATGLLVAILILLSFGSADRASGAIQASATPQLTLSPTPDQPDITPAVSGASVRFSSIYMLNTSDGWAEAFVSNSTIDLFLHTGDGGKTWTNVTPPGYGVGVNIANYSTQFLDSNHAWIAYIDIDHSLLYLWRTETAGRLWTKTTLNAPHANSQELEFIDPKQGWLLLLDCCAAGNEFAELYQTSDGGTSWNKIAGSTDGSDSSGLSNHYHGLPIFETPSIGWMTVVGFGGGGSLSQTLDGGKTWNEVKLPVAPYKYEYANCAPASLTLFSAGNLTLVVKCSSLSPDDPVPPSALFLYHTEDEGKTWTITPITVKVAMSPDSPFHDEFDPRFFLISPTVGFMLAVDANASSPIPTVYETTNGGQTWRMWSPLPTAFYTLPDSPEAIPASLDFLNAQVAWAINRASGGLEFTQDAGKTWASLNAHIVSLPKN